MKRSALVVVYHLEPLGSEAWELWLEPVSLITPGLREALEPRGWPSLR